MSASQKSKTFRNDKSGTALLIALMIIGLAGNYFKYPVFLNIDFLFGSIFAMLILQFFGVGRGIAAAAIIASYTYVIWNHPYAIIIMTAEVAVVGWLFQRRRVSLVFADMLYWLVIGMPLVYLFYHGVMHISLSNAYITMTKQAVNGIANALVARFIFTGYVLRTRAVQISYREIVYNLLAFFVLCPTLLLLAISSRSDFAATDRGIRTALAEVISHDVRHLDRWVVDRKASIAYLAEKAATSTPQQMQSLLEHTRKTDRNFKRIGLLNKDAVTTAFFPLADELGQTNIGKSFADRPFIPELRRRLAPMLSEVVMGKTGAPKPMVTMLAPVLSNGAYNGYISGILSLDRISEHLDRGATDNATLFALIDKNGNVIATNRTDQKVMTPFLRPKGTMKRLDNRISQWFPQLPPNTPASERWKRSLYVAEASIGDLAEWKLVLEQPVAPFQKALYDNYTGKLIVLFLVLLGALALAEVLSRRFISTQENLQVITRDLPTKVAKSTNIDWPESGILEVNQLVENFKDAAGSLATQFYEIRQINESLEQRVEERTNDLNNIKNELGIILGNTPLGIAKTIDRKLVWFNCNFSEMFHYPQDELACQTTRKLYTSADAYECLGREAYPVLAQGKLFETEQELISKDGIPIQTRYIGKAIDPSDMSKGTIWLVEDITKRRQEEEEKKVFEQRIQKMQKLESLGVLAGGIAHDFNNILAIIIGYCALAKLDSKNIDEKLTEIEKASERAAALCRQMLAYAGHTQTPKSRVNMATVVSDAVDMLSSAGHKNIAIARDIPPDLPCVHGDASQISQIVMNLIINATEAIGDAKGEIGVVLTNPAITAEKPERDHLGQAISPGTYVCLEITDNGCGMDEETRQRIFEPFFTTKFTGRGLGLSATLGIVTSHGGALQLMSRPGEGTTFKVYLPALAMDSDHGAPLQHVGKPEHWMGSGTVLLVEDEGHVRLITKAMLHEFGFAVIEAANGKEALEIYRKESSGINLVITDIGMPVMDGYELFFELKKLNPELPIVISSGFGDKTITSRIPQKDIAGIISKPYKIGQLQAVLKRVHEDGLNRH